MRTSFVNHLTSALAVGVLAILSQCSLKAQTLNTQPTYQLIKSTSLSNSAETLTVQQTSTNNVSAGFEWVTVNCSAACVIAFSQNGTAATGTALTPTRINNSPPSQLTGYRSSNVGSGTTLSSFSLSSGLWTFDIRAFYIGGGGTAQNFSVSCTIATSGTCAITMQWKENPN